MSTSALVQHIQAVIIGLANQLVGGNGKTDVGHRDETVLVTLHRGSRHENGDQWYEVELYVLKTYLCTAPERTEVVDFLRSLAFAVIDPSLGSEKIIRPEHAISVTCPEPDKNRFCAIWKVPA